MSNAGKKNKWIISNKTNNDVKNRFRIVNSNPPQTNIPSRDIKRKFIIKTSQSSSIPVTPPNPKTLILNTSFRSSSIYDVKKGFMLAESYYDDYNNPTVNPIGWWFSEKYDGVRAIWNGVELYTRNLTQIMAPQWFTNQLPKNFSLDGELYIKRNYFNETSGYVRKKVPIDYEWQNIRYMIFDVPHLSSVAFEDRMNRLNEILKGSNNRGTQASSVIHVVPQIRITSIEQIMHAYDEYTANGAEGLMLRKPNSPYFPYRCNLILKLKVHSDEEAYVTGWQEGNNKNKGKLGALFIKWNYPELIEKKYKISIMPSIEFKVGSGFKDVDRCPITDAKSKYPVGTVITIGFNGLQISGKPRHPTFKGIKWDT